MLYPIELLGQRGGMLTAGPIFVMPFALLRFCFSQPS